MKALAGIGAAVCIAIAAAFWFMTRPAVVVVKVAPLAPSSAVGRFHHVNDDAQLAAESDKIR